MTEGEAPRSTRRTVISVALVVSVAIAMIAALAQRVMVDQFGASTSRIQGIPSAPRIVVQPTSFHFGAVRARGSVDKEFVIRNVGGAELVIADVQTSCGCTVASGWAARIPPGRSTPLRVTVTAGEAEGPIVETVTLKSNDDLVPNLEVRVWADVVGAARPSPQP